MDNNEETLNTTPKILVAEDNDSNYLLIKHILKGRNLTHVYTGVEAVEATKNNNFALILMDIKMPEMNGLIATEKIREFNSDIPIVAVTANAFDSDRVNALKAGCNDFLTKPIKKEELWEIVSKYID